MLLPDLEKGEGFYLAFFKVRQQHLSLVCALQLLSPLGFLLALSLQPGQRLDFANSQSSHSIRSKQTLVFSCRFPKLTMAIYRH